ncbi:hypothetical protein ARMSODRAFT_126184 [Armillaria solidipes]|uniref:Uncharacterized protein n=1 Tax=Armillaria solidipes TaxID=1076256 RepID=A0A2H3BMI2_9AGAR|nr:hypothetical protein ARMSODRAFT_126184 [Armillaria solidipes]
MHLSSSPTITSFSSVFELLDSSHKLIVRCFLNRSPFVENNFCLSLWQAFCQWSFTFILTHTSFSSLSLIGLVTLGGICSHQFKIRVDGRTRFTDELEPPAGA